MDAIGIHRVDSPCLEENQQTGEDTLFLLYDSPHRLFSSLDLADVSIIDTSILDGYRELLEISDQSLRLISLERLSTIPGDRLQACLFNSSAEKLTARLTEPSPLEALITIAILQQDSELLSAYMDVELKADLLGGKVDSGYIHRLKSSLAGRSSEDYLLEWHASQITINDLQHQLSSLKAEVNAQEDDVQRSKEELDDCTQRNTTLGQEIQLVAEELKSANIQVEDLKDTISQKEAELKSVQHLLQQAEHQTREALKELESYFLRVSELEKEKITVTNTVNSQRSDLDSQALKLQELEAALVNLNAELLAVGQQNAEHTQQLEAKERECVEIQGRFNAEIKQKTEELASCFRRVSELEKENITLADTVKGQRSDLDSQAVKLKELEAALVNLNAELLAAGRENAEHSQKLEAKERECVEIQGRFNVEVDQKTAEMKQMAQEVEQLNARLRQAYIELEHYFLSSSRLQSLLDRHEQQAMKTFCLLSRLHSSLSGHQSQEH